MADRLDLHQETAHDDSVTCPHRHLLLLLPKLLLQQLLLVQVSVLQQLLQLLPLPLLLRAAVPSPRNSPLGGTPVRSPVE